MARKAAKRRSPDARAKDMKEIVTRSVALQVELLGAAAQIWSEMFESMAAYTRTASEELVNLSSRGDANAAVDNIIRVAREKLNRLEKLPETIGRGFPGRVRARAKR